MSLTKQELGHWGETLVKKKCACPKCKRSGCLEKLPTNFKCADVICDFCGYLAQVKASRVPNIDKLPNRIPSAGWKPQKERMDSAIYFPLFLVLKALTAKEYAIYYLSADLQDPAMFVPRKELGPDAKRAGWQGYYYDLTSTKESFVRLI